MKAAAAQLDPLPCLSSKWRERVSANRQLFSGTSVRFFKKGMQQIAIVKVLMACLSCFEIFLFIQPPAIPQSPNSALVLQPGVLGYFEFNGSPQPPGYLTFFTSALHSLKKGKQDSY